MKELFYVIVGGAIGFLSALGMRLIIDHFEGREK